MKTINLLPKLRQLELRYIAMLRSVWVVVMLSAASFAAVFLVQAGARLYLHAEAASIEKEIAELQEQVKKEENAKVKAQVKIANDLVSDYKNLADASPKWSKEGVRINNFAIDPLKKSVNISGFSATREAVIELYKNILADADNFFGIDYPLENVSKPANINFHFTFFVSNGLLQ